MATASGGGECGGHHAASLALDEALARVMESVPVVAGTTRIGLFDALGRVLAEDVHAAADVPGHTGSAMDGYALRSRDVAADGGTTLRVVGESFAGHPFAGTLGAGECVRIMTGAVVPAGADAVVLQEDVERSGDRVSLRCGCRAGENVRPAGEDLARGELVLGAGRRLAAADLGVLASVGVAQVLVRRRVRVACFSTGDELRPVGEPLAPGQIHDSNRYTLRAMLAEAGAECIDLGVVRDDPGALRRAFAAAAERADAVVTSGGASVGDADYVKEVLAGLGEVSFWHVAVKPGRPLVFGKLGSAAFFGLPGNPVSVAVTFLQVVAPALARMAGAAPQAPLRFRARAAGRLRKKPGRMEFQRGVLQWDGRGEPVVDSTGHQGSGILRSMSRANCFIVLERERGGVEAGEWVTVEPLVSRWPPR